MAIDRQILARTRAQPSAGGVRRHLLPACSHAGGQMLTSRRMRHAARRSRPGHAGRWMARQGLPGTTPCGGRLPAARQGLASDSGTGPCGLMSTRRWTRRRERGNGAASLFEALLQEALAYLDT